MLLSKIEGKMAQSTDLLQGTLDMLILLADEPEYAGGGETWLRRVSQECLIPGAVYRAICHGQCEPRPARVLRQPECQLH
jgi:hypothetical protein